MAMASRVVMDWGFLWGKNLRGETCDYWGDCIGAAGIGGFGSDWDCGAGGWRS